MDVCLPAFREDQSTPSLGLSLAAVMQQSSLILHPSFLRSFLYPFSHLPGIYLGVLLADNVLELEQCGDSSLRCHFSERTAFPRTQP